MRGELTEHQRKVLRQLKRKLETQQETFGFEFVDPENVETYLQEFPHYDVADAFLGDVTADLWDLDLEPDEEHVHAHVADLARQGGMSEEEMEERAVDLAVADLQEHRQTVSQWIEDAREDLRSPGVVGRRRRRLHKL